MKSLFNESDNQEIVGRVNKVTPDAKPGWGKMNSAQMLAHCSVGLKIAFGEITPKRSIIGILLGRIVKKKILGAESFRKNSPTSKEFIIPDGVIFYEEKIALISNVKRFDEAGPDYITKNPHPFFGKISIGDWDNLMWKHLDHHLRQFGV